MCLELRHLRIHRGSVQQKETTMKESIWVVVNWCEPTPESDAGCFGTFFPTFDAAYSFAKKDAAAFKKNNCIEGEIACNDDDGRVDLEWGDIMHHWLVEELKPAKEA
jgi:hypothetical protein